MQTIPAGYGQVYNFLLALIPGETFQVLPSSWNAFRFPMIFNFFYSFLSFFRVCFKTQICFLLFETSWLICVFSHKLLKCEDEFNIAQY